MKRLAFLLSIGLLLAVPAYCDQALTVVAPAGPDQQYQQQENSPCIFGDPSCHQPAGFGYTSIAGGGQLQNWGTTALGGPVQSPTYTGEDIFDAIGSYGFIVGVDINQAQQMSPTITYFAEYINGVLVAHYGTAGADSGGTVLQMVNNGNGYADDLITGFVAPGAEDDVYFQLTYLDANDGTEEFFLINAQEPPPVVPEPATLTLLGTGLLGLGGVIRRRLRG